MKKVIIDTNCLISFVTDRNPTQQKIIATLFDYAQHQKIQIVCHHHVVSEFVYVLTSVYSLPKEKVQKMIADLVDMPACMYTSDVDIQTVFSLWPSHVPDYGDAILAAYCKKTGVSLATFDTKFKKALTTVGITVQKI